jgi:hypothetical protein
MNEVPILCNVLQSHPIDKIPNPDRIDIFRLFRDRYTNYRIFK